MGREMMVMMFAMGTIKVDKKLSGGIDVNHRYIEPAAKMLAAADAPHSFSS